MEEKLQGIFPTLNTHFRRLPDGNAAVTQHNLANNDSLLPYCVCSGTPLKALGECTHATRTEHCL
ncbi:hypothetical protein EK904_009091 [Melospiza melodia maxima]|nr:hypothetical protein EK904_009091 [Melospiza melodia maxima]